jgi:UDP-N-acetylmuramyl tripeptide synthase
MSDSRSDLRVSDRLVAAAARSVGRLSRAFDFGGGSSVPGLVVQKLSPGYVARRASALEAGVIVVSGTNGKTTTAAMIHAILQRAGREPVTNASGANLFRGVAGALLDAPPDARSGVFEVDEGALARVVPAVRPRVLVLTNVFRDQLDRFGEPETVAGLLAAAARALPDGSRVVANADDPLLWYAVSDRSPVGFGVAPIDPGDDASVAGELEICPQCSAPLVVTGRTVAHLGEARCTRCTWHSDRPAFRVEITDSSLGGMKLRIADTTVGLAVGGVHNAYNAAAAVAAADAAGVPAAEACRALESFVPRFGRGERLPVGDRSVRVLLMKNPGGAAAVLDQLARDPTVGAVIVAVSDLSADGRDISWIWDADFERLAGVHAPVIAAGRRAADVAVRLKYGGVEAAAVERDPGKAVRAALAACPPDRTPVVLATYTAMLDVRRAVLRSRRARASDVAA